MVTSKEKNINAIDLTDNQVRHLDMIEKIIERMGQNSFALKGWAMTLVVAICGLAAAGSDKCFAVVAVVPIIIFWFLDALYLQKERKFRELYNAVASGREIRPFTMDIRGCSTKSTKYIHCLFSPSEWLFYIGILIGTAVVFIWLVFLTTGGAQ